MEGRLGRRFDSARFHLQKGNEMSVLWLIVMFFIGMLMLGGFGKADFVPGVLLGIICLLAPLLIWVYLGTIPWEIEEQTTTTIIQITYTEDHYNLVDDKIKHTTTLTTNNVIIYQGKIVHIDSKFRHDLKEGDEIALTKYKNNYEGFIFSPQIKYKYLGQ